MAPSGEPPMTRVAPASAAGIRAVGASTAGVPAAGVRDTAVSTEEVRAVGASTPEAEAACASCPPEPAVRFPKIEVRRTCATTCSRLCTSGLGEAPPATAE